MEAGGAIYDFFIDVKGVIGEGDSVRVTGKKMTWVVEMWTVGAEGTLE